MFSILYPSSQDTVTFPAPVSPVQSACRKNQVLARRVEGGRTGLTAFRFLSATTSCLTLDKTSYSRAADSFSTICRSTTVFTWRGVDFFIMAVISSFIIRMVTRLKQAIPIIPAMQIQELMIRLVLIFMRNNPTFRRNGGGELTKYQQRDMLCGRRSILRICEQKDSRHLEQHGMHGIKSDKGNLGTFIVAELFETAQKKGNTH